MPAEIDEKAYRYTCLAFQFAPGMVGDRIRAALVAYEAAKAVEAGNVSGEPIAWLTEWQFESGGMGGWSITRSAENAAYELDTKRRWDRVSSVTQTALIPAYETAKAGNGAPCPVPPYLADRCTCPTHATPPAPAAPAGTGASP